MKCRVSTGLHHSTPLVRCLGPLLSSTFGEFSGKVSIL